MHRKYNNSENKQLVICEGMVPPLDSFKSSAQTQGITCAISRCAPQVCLPTGFHFQKKSQRYLDVHFRFTFWWHWKSNHVALHPQQNSTFSNQSRLKLVEIFRKTKSWGERTLLDKGRRFSRWPSPVQKSHHTQSRSLRKLQ